MVSVVDFIELSPEKGFFEDVNPLEVVTFGIRSVSRNSQVSVDHLMFEVLGEVRPKQRLVEKVLVVLQGRIVFPIAHLTDRLDLFKFKLIKELRKEIQK